jgi:catechol 2,3-dioxygenase-like lactoylglutathione lyase family enzyme
MIDHTGINLSDFAQRKAFYPEALTRKPEYWGAFVLDPDGHNMEMVWCGLGRA